MNTRLNSELVNASPLGDSPVWDDILSQTYGLQKAHFRVGSAAVHLFSRPKRRSLYSTAPYVTDGGCYIEDCADGALLLSRISEFQKEKQGSPILLKTRREMFSGATEGLILDDSYSTLILDLHRGEEQIWNKCIKGSVRAQVRKGMRNNIAIKFGGSELFDDLYNVISRCWRDLGTPMHSRHFLSNILTHFGELSSIVIIYYRSQPVSAALLVAVADTLHHPFVGTIKTYSSLAVNSVLYWEIVKYGIRNQLRYFDMGRSRATQGTFRYKRTWGAVPIPLNYYYIVERTRDVPQLETPLVKGAVQCWKRLPVPFTRWLGPYFIRNVL